MAYVKLLVNTPIAGYTLDSTTPDLYGAIALTDTVTFDRYGGQIQGHSYPEVLRFGMNSYSYYGVLGELAFGGNVEYILDYNSPFNYSITGGYVSHYYEAVSHPSAGLYASTDVYGFMADALEVGAAMDSPSTSDDLKLIKKMLSGNDQFDITYDGNKKVYGYEGDDNFKVNSNQGIDIFDGGSGSDTIDYDFNLHDQSYSYTNNQLIINHSGGKKTLKNFETFSFNDGTFTSDQLKLGKITKIYDQPSSSNSFGIYKQKSNAYIVENNVREQTVGDYGDVDGIILWTKNGQSYHKFTSDPVTAVKGSGERNFTIDVYRGSGNSWIQDTFKDIDQNGKYRYEKTQKLSLSNLLGLEDQIANDLNNDGVIGDRIVDVLSNGSGSKGFYKLSSESYMIDNNGLNVGSSPQNQIIPHKNGNPFSFKYTPTGTISTDEYDQSGGHTPVMYVISQNNSRSNTWTYDAFNSNTGKWEYSGGSFSYSELLNWERSFNTDLNNDGKIGDTVNEKLAEHSRRNDALWKTDSGAMIIDDSNLSQGSQTSNPLVLKKGNVLYKNTNKSLGLATDTTSKVDKNGIHYNSDDIYIYYGSGNSWSKDTFEDGLYKKTSKLTLTQLLAEESFYTADLNKDSVIGDTVVTVISNQDSKGFYKIASGAYVIDRSGLQTGDVSQSPVILKANNVHKFLYNPTGAKSFEFWDPSTGNSVLEIDIYSGSGNKWLLQTFDASNGNLISLVTIFITKFFQMKFLSKRPYQRWSGWR